MAARTSTGSVASYSNHGLFKLRYQHGKRRCFEIFLISRGDSKNGPLFLVRSSYISHFVTHLLISPPLPETCPSLMKPFFAACGIKIMLANLFKPFQNKKKKKRKMISGEEIIFTSVFFLLININSESVKQVVPLECWTVKIS